MNESYPGGLRMSDRSRASRLVEDLAWFVETGMAFVSESNMTRCMHCESRNDTPGMIFQHVPNCTLLIAQSLRQIIITEAKMNE